jgi:hypothetical protein
VITLKTAGLGRKSFKSHEPQKKGPLNLWQSKYFIRSRSLARNSSRFVQFTFHGTFQKLKLLKCEQTEVNFLDFFSDRTKNWNSNPRNLCCRNYSVMKTGRSIPFLSVMQSLMKRTKGRAFSTVDYYIESV